MSAAHEVLVTIEAPFASLADAGWLRETAVRVLESEQLASAELGIVITDDDTVQRLNRQYAGEDKPTDVLSFSLREGEEFAAPDATERLGEVIISYHTAERQALEAGIGVRDELEHLLVHGILHLLGYDHAEPAEEQRMRARESELLGGHP